MMVIYAWLMLVALVRNSVATSTLCHSIHVPEIHLTTPSKCNVWLQCNSKRSHPTMSSSRGISYYVLFRARFPFNFLLPSISRSIASLTHTLSLHVRDWRCLLWFCVSFFVFVPPNWKRTPRTTHNILMHWMVLVQMVYNGSSHYLIVAPLSSLAQQSINFVINQHCTVNGHGHPQYCVWGYDRVCTFILFFSRVFCFCTSLRRRKKINF